MRSRTGVFWVLVPLAVLGCGGSSGGAGAVCNGQTVDLQSDIQNCGSCGNVCAKPSHASAACNQGSCGSGACDAGWGGTNCETCLISQCTPALPETGAVFQAMASGSSYGSKVQSAPSGHTNIAVMGEPTPPSAVPGIVTQTSAQHQNISGLNAALH